jgi:hypothetical protein
MSRGVECAESRSQFLEKAPECAAPLLDLFGRRQREGEVVVLDDSFEHAVSYTSQQEDALRVVLIIDLWHPLLAETDRVAIDE